MQGNNSYAGTPKERQEGLGQMKDRRRRKLKPSNTLANDRMSDAVAQIHTHPTDAFHLLYTFIIVINVHIIAASRVLSTRKSHAHCS